MNVEIVVVVVVLLLGVMIPFLSLILWVRLALAEVLCLHLHKQVLYLQMEKIHLGQILLLGNNMLSI
jgi:hypothetical protein